ncbi:SulP family inorganic anion transporter [Longitalea luteola]|uniref:SulP family inorganic anion transporter n=1 Tax=Longitalea luteola TaxID=2812563 RepID=UPI001A96F84C|nr:SulP family inorganic anion transporter [Longitalea luteola]
MKGVFNSIKNDISSGIVVFLVAVPLCLGIALASGAPFFSGMIAGIIGGIVIGSISNSSLSVSGPAAGLTAVVLTGIATLGSFQIFLCSVFLAGALQFVLGMLRAGSVANYFPGSVIKGMLTGIGIIIIMKQLPHVVGYYQTTTAINSVSDLLSNFHLGVTIISLLAFLVLIFWEKKLVNKIRLIPGALAAVILGVIVNQVFVLLYPEMALEGRYLVNVPVADTVTDFLNFFTLPEFSSIWNDDVWITAATIAVVASVETLLCIDAVDKMDPLRRVTDQNRELKAQGVGNMVSGLLGGLPLTSVIVRSSANVQAGAKTKASTITHGLLLLASCALVPQLLNRIPLGSLAAVLIVTGYKLARIEIFKKMYRSGIYQFLPFIITIVGVVATDLLKGVALGLVTSAASILYLNMKNAYYFHKEKYHDGEIIKIHLSEEVSFLNKASIKMTLQHLPAHSKVIIDASNAKYIDFDVLELIREFKDIQAPEKQIDCQLMGFKDSYGVNNMYAVTSEPASAFKNNIVHSDKYANV